MTVTANESIMTHDSHFGLLVLRVFGAGAGALTCSRICGRRAPMQRSATLQPTATIQLQVLSRSQLAEGDGEDTT